MKELKFIKNYYDNDNNPTKKIPIISDLTYIVLSFLVEKDEKERFILNGKLEGEYVEYDDQHKYLRNYTDGELNGDYKEWDDKGNIIYHIYYNKGRALGTYKIWWNEINRPAVRYIYNINFNPKNVVRWNYKYSKTTDLHGPEAKEVEVFYHQAKNNEEWWYAFGKVRIKITHSDDKKQSEYKEFWGDGKVRIICNYENRRLEGKYDQWFGKNREYRLSLKYKNGKKVGKEKLYKNKKLMLQSDFYIVDLLKNIYLCN